jgi:DNA polymerase III alpha subunit
LHGAPFRPLSRALDRTYGLMIYQEDVSRVAMTEAGFSPGQADRLRKTLKAGFESPDLMRYRSLFFSQGARRGTPAVVLEQLWDMIRSFQGYSFCKAHSASYALVSYKLAYLKRHFPLEFFLSVINNGGGYYSRQTYLNQCRRLGIPILSPDVNRSLIRYTAEQGGIRVGLGQIRRISRNFVRRLLEERGRGGPFSDPADFFRRLQPGLQETRMLVRSGALDGIANGMVRPRLLYTYLRGSRGEELFAPEPVPLADYPEELKLLDELRTLGLMISRHPVSLFSARAQERVRELALPALIRSSELPRCLGREVSLVGLVASGKEVLTAGSVMVFVTLEDEFSLFESVLFPAVFGRYRACVDGGGVLLIGGRVEQEMGAFSVTVRRVSRLF